MSRELDFVDVSHWQGAVPWNRFRDAGVKGGIAKAIDGYYMPPTYKTHIDPQFATNWQALENFDLRGAYVFIRFDVNRSGGLTPADQVNLLIDTIEAQDSPRKPTDILVLDVEQDASQIAHISKSARAKMLEDALKEAEKRWDKEYIWIYTGDWWWDDQIVVTSHIISFHCWAAYWGTRSLSNHVPKGWRLEDVIAHQWSGSKKIVDITVDHDEFLFDWDTYLKIKPPAPPLPPEPPPEPPTPPEPEPPVPPIPPTTPPPTPPTLPSEPKGCLPTIIPALIELIGKRK